MTRATTTRPEARRSPLAIRRWFSASSSATPAGNATEVVLANKLWWEFWPEQNAETELDASLGRMRMDHIDLIYVERPPPGLTVEEIVREVGALIHSGKARAWGVLNWPADLIEEAAREAADQTVSPPSAAQLAYSLVNR